MGSAASWLAVAGCDFGSRTFLFVLLVLSGRAFLCFVLLVFSGRALFVSLCFFSLGALSCFAVSK